jgi:catecholate siderophore receptor
MEMPMPVHRVNAAARHPRRSLLSIAVVLALTGTAHAQSGDAAQDDAESTELSRVLVEGERMDDYKPEQASSPKYTQPLVDTPQTITVLTEKLLLDQGSLGLSDALRNVPGITMQVGEGGAGSGDFIRIRGFDASNDINIDGFSDSLQYSRNDLFNFEAIEVVKGPNSAYSGAGNAAGSINLVSKAPQLADFIRGTAAIGTNDLGRITADVNQSIDSMEGAAFRINFMAHDQDVARRDEIFQKRWGVAPSLAFGLDTDTRVTLSYFHQTDDNLIDYGVPFLLTGEELPIDISNYYGLSNIDTEEQDIDLATVKVEHVFSDTLRLTNQTRYGTVDRYAIWSTPQNRNATGPEDAPCYPCTFENAALAIREGRFEDALFQTAGPQGIGRDIEQTLFANQTNLGIDFATGSVEHNLVTGVEIARDEYQRDGIAVGGLQRLVNLYRPVAEFNGPTTFTRTRNAADNQIDTLAVYVFDTLSFGENWLLSGGLRGERFDADTLATAADGTITTTDHSDTLVSGNIGLTWKPMENGSVYLSYANAKEPPAISAAGTGATGTENADPQENDSVELGTKWELFDDRLLVGAALFRTERTNELIDDDGIEDTPQVFDGKRRVQGVELSATGKITENWSVYGAYTYQDSEIVKASANSPIQGEILADTPEHSASAWTTVALPYGFVVGGGVQYVGERKPGPADSDRPWRLDSYTVVDLMASYVINDAFSLRLNVNNVTDEEYFERPRVTGTYAFAIPGEGRNAMLTLNYDF